MYHNIVVHLYPLLQLCGSMPVITSWRSDLPPPAKNPPSYGNPPSMTILLLLVWNITEIVHGPFYSLMILSQERTIT